MKGISFKFTLVSSITFPLLAEGFHDVLLWICAHRYTSLLLLCPPVPLPLGAHHSSHCLDSYHHHSLPLTAEVTDRMNPVLPTYPHHPHNHIFKLWDHDLPKTSVQFSHSVVSDSLRPHESQHTRPPCQSPNSESPLKFMSIESVMPSNHLILCHPLLLPPSVSLPSIRVFSNESTLHMRWPKYWSFSFSISPFNEHPGLISFRMDWLDLLAVQGTLKSLLQQHSSKAPILRCSAFLDAWFKKKKKKIFGAHQKYLDT